MKYPAVVLASAATMLLGACGMNSDEIREHMGNWKGQTDTALNGAFGLPQKTLDMAGGSQVYHYEFNKGRCVIDFQIDPKRGDAFFDARGAWTAFTTSVAGIIHEHVSEARIPMTRFANVI